MKIVSMEPLSLQGCSRDVQVLGIGHLAAAVRVELARRGLGQGGPQAGPLVVACSDFHNPASFREARRQALKQGCPIFMACLGASGQHPRLAAARGAARLVDRIAGFLT
jgi:hypothetical protein